MEYERLAELVRLLYVTLTRAKYRCYLAWGPIHGSETSALAYLLHYRSKIQETINLAALKDFIKGLNDSQMEEDIVNLVKKSEGAIALMPIPAPADLTYIPPHAETTLLTCREFSANIERDWRTTSFSAIVSGRDYPAEIPDRDKTVDTEDPPLASKPDGPGRQSRSIFDFPHGTSAGSCLHDILEHIDFALENPDDARRLIAEKLAGYGFEDTWTDSVYRAMENVLSVPIMGKEVPFSLSSLPFSERLHEVEFYMPVAWMSAQRLGEIIRSYGGETIPDRFAERIEGLGFTPHKGMLRGFIDMVFQYNGRYYLVDWKSNFLGDTENYRREKLYDVMEREFYILQYLIYTVALHGFLGMRIENYHYRDHFGGIFYLFLRGIDAERGPEYGVFFDQPRFDLIHDLSNSMAGPRIHE